MSQTVNWHAHLWWFINSNQCRRFCFEISVNSFRTPTSTPSFSYMLFRLVYLRISLISRRKFPSQGKSKTNSQLGKKHKNFPISFQWNILQWPEVVQKKRGSIFFKHYNKILYKKYIQQQQKEKCLRWNIY